MATSIYVGNLPWSATQEGVESLFSPYGEVLSVKLVSDRRELLALEAFLRRAEEYLRLNVGPKHVTGYLSTLSLIHI